MTISSTLLALVLMPLCLWIYSRAWINTPVVDLMPFGAIILTLGSTLIPIGLGVVLRYRSARVADLVLKVREEKSLKVTCTSNETNYYIHSFDVHGAPRGDFGLTAHCVISPS